LFGWVFGFSMVALLFLVVFFFFFFRHSCCIYFIGTSSEDENVASPQPIKTSLIFQRGRKVRIERHYKQTLNKRVEGVEETCILRRVGGIRVVVRISLRWRTRRCRVPRCGVPHWRRGTWRDWESRRSNRCGAECSG